MILTKSMYLEINKSLDEEGTFYGWASTFYNKDYDHDIILPGAFKESIKRKSNLPMLFNHDKNQVIGKVDCWEESEGLRVKGTFNLNDPYAQNIYECVKMGALSELSIGFIGIDKEAHSGDYGVTFKEVDLYECSIVVKAANPLAQIDPIKQKSIESLMNNKKNGGEKTLSKNNELSSYLNSQKSLNDFIEFMTKGFKGRTDKVIDSKKQWSEYVKELSAYPMPFGYVYPTTLYPQPWIDSINSVFRDTEDLFSTMIYKPDITVKHEAFESTAGGELLARAFGSGEKIEAELEFLGREIESDFIYIYLKIPRKLEKENIEVYNSFFMQHLPNEIKEKMLELAFFGDTSGEITSYLGMVDDTSEYTTNIVASGSMFNDIMDAMTNLNGNGQKIIVMSKTSYADLRKQNPCIELVEYWLNCKIYTPDWYPLNGPEFIMYNKDSYEIIGQLVPDVTTKLGLKRNEIHVLAENFTGGALIKGKSCVVCK